MNPVVTSVLAPPIFTDTISALTYEPLTDALYFVSYSTAAAGSTFTISFAAGQTTAPLAADANLATVQLTPGWAFPATLPGPSLAATAASIVDSGIRRAVCFTDWLGASMLTSS